MAEPTTVMVVDDHPIWRDAVARDLADDGFDVVATADGVASARRRAAVVRPAVVLMDMRLGDGDGAQATAQVLEVSPSSRVLVLSASDERDDVLEAVKAGASRIPGEERVAGRTGRRGAGHRGRSCGVHTRAGRPGAGGVPPDGEESRTAPPRA